MEVKSPDGENRDRETPTKHSFNKVHEVRSTRRRMKVLRQNRRQQLCPAYHYFFDINR